MSSGAESVVKVSPSLPGPELVGLVAEWVLPDDGHVISGLHVTAQFLGVAQTRRKIHRGHYGRPHAKRHERCGACRWFEPRIFREVTYPPAPFTSSMPLPASGRYLIHRVGRSIVPTEVDLCSYEYVDTALEVIDALATRPADDEPFISYPAESVLESASQHDVELCAAYAERVGSE